MAGGRDGGPFVISGSSPARQGGNPGRDRAKRRSSIPWPIITFGRDTIDPVFRDNAGRAPSRRLRSSRRCWRCRRRRTRRSRPLRVREDHNTAGRCSHARSATAECGNRRRRGGCAAAFDGVREFSCDAEDADTAAIVSPVRRRRGRRIRRTCLATAPLASASVSLNCQAVQGPFADFGPT